MPTRVARRPGFGRQEQGTPPAFCFPACFSGAALMSREWRCLVPKVAKGGTEVRDKRVMLRPTVTTGAEGRFARSAPRRSKLGRRRVNDRSRAAGVGLLVAGGDCSPQGRAQAQVDETDGREQR